MPMELINAQGQAFGSVAEALLACNMETKGLRTNSVLRYKEWEVIDKALVEEVQTRLVAVADLKSRGLVHNVGAGLAAMVLVYEKIGKMGKAKLSMDGEEQGRRDRVLYETGYLPLPICFADFSINARVLAASRLNGSNLDDTQTRMAGRSVAEELEDLLINGDGTFTYGGGTIVGYLSAPGKNTGSYTAWGSSGADPVADALAMKQASINAGFRGPWVMYTPTEYESVLDEDYSSVKGEKTVRARIQAIEGIQECKSVDTLADGNLLLVQMTPDVVRMVTALPLQNVEWKEGAGTRTNFKAMTIDVPQVRSTKAGASGVTHFSAA